MLARGLVKLLLSFLRWNVEPVEKAHITVLARVQSLTRGLRAAELRLKFEVAQTLSPSLGPGSEVSYGIPVLWQSLKQFQDCLLGAQEKISLRDASTDRARQDLGTLREALPRIFLPRQGVQVVEDFFVLWFVPDVKNKVDLLLL